MLLKINQNNVQYQNRYIRVESYNLSVADNFASGIISYDVIFTTKTPHNLKIGDKISYNFPINNKTKTIVSTVSSNNFTNNTFSIRINCFQEITVTNVFQYQENNETKYAISFDGNISTCESTGDTYIFVTYLKEYITGQCLSDDLFTTTVSGLTNGITLYVEDRLGIKNNQLPSGFTIQELSLYLNFNIPLNNDIDNGYMTEDVSKTYFEEQKKRLIGDIVDYENLVDIGGVKCKVVMKREEQV